MRRTRMHITAAESLDRQPRRGWFAETLVVVGILAFAYAAITLQPQQANPVLDLTITGSVR